MTELLFKDDVLETSAFLCPYQPKFLTSAESDALFNRFVDFNFCQKQTRFGDDIKRMGVTYMSDLNHIQAGYAQTRGNLVVDDDGCVGPRLLLNEAPDEILSLRQKLSQFSKRDVNYLSVQIYRDGDDLINWHRHREDDAIDTPVFIISTGSERTFHLRQINDYSKRWNRTAEHGSLITLPASFNDTHHHAVLPEKNIKGPRISVNTKCLLPPRVWDCHAGKRYPGSLAPELPALFPAVYVGCKTLSYHGQVLREGTIYGNGKNPFAGHDAITKNEDEFRRYAERRMRDSSFRAQAIAELRNRHLLCWCKQDGPNRNPFCHARVWLDIVNRREYLGAA